MCEVGDWTEWLNLFPGFNLSVPQNPTANNNSKKCTPQNAAASPFLGQFCQHPATQRLIVVLLRSVTGGTHCNGPLGHHLAMPYPPSQMLFSPLFFVDINGAAFPSYCQFSPKQATRWLIVVCLIFFHWANQSNVAHPLWFHQGLPPPPHQPKFPRKFMPLYDAAAPLHGQI